MHQAVVVQLSLQAVFVAFAFEICGSKHFKFLGSTVESGELEFHRPSGQFQLVHMLQEVEPAVQIAPQFGKLFYELGEFNDVNLQAIRVRRRVPIVPEAETLVAGFRFGEQLVVQQEDRDRRLQLGVLVGFGQLLGKQLGPIVQHTLLEVLVLQ